MSELVSEVLAAAAAAEAKLASTKVEKPIELELDLGNMLAQDMNVLDNATLTDSSLREEYMRALARDNTQLLVNAIWSLPTERVEEVIVAKFPPPTTKLPREKPLPKPKPMTKWEKYAKEKGIVKKKRKDRMVWDDVVKEWVPQFGYKKIKVDEKKTWCIPLKQGDDPEEDPFKKLAEEKSERVAKNELQRLRNLAKTKKVNVPTVGVVPPTTKGPVKQSDSDDLKKTAELVKASTASLGKFQEKLDKKLEKNSAPKGAKRKFESNTGDMQLEKQKHLNILDSITNKKSKIDIDQAVGKHISQNEPERPQEKRKDSKAKAKKSGKGGGKMKRNKSHFANKGGKGKFTGKTYQGKGGGGNKTKGSQGRGGGKGKAKKK